jgi:hypothetical protein
MKFKRVALILIILLTSVVLANANTQNAVTVPLPPSGVYKFQGKLNGRIPIFLWFVLKDSVLKGEVTYLKTAKRLPITIVGTINSTGGLEILEFNNKGLISGIYNGQFEAKSFIGTWVAPVSGRELKFVLVNKDTLIKTDANLTANSIDGEYDYHYGKVGGDGGVNIRHVNGNNYKISMGAVTGAPANNVANVEDTTIRIVNNTAIFKLGPQCAFRINIYKGFMVIKRLTDLMPCGFGMNASIEGTFMKITGKPL